MHSISVVIFTESGKKNIPDLRWILFCVVTLHNLLHLPEDIANFSTLDNFWCYSFERAVKKYVERSSNCKNLESTFAVAEC